MYGPRHMVDGCPETWRTPRQCWRGGGRGVEGPDYVVTEGTTTTGAVSAGAARTSVLSWSQDSDLRTARQCWRGGGRGVEGPDYVVTEGTTTTVAVSAGAARTSVLSWSQDSRPWTCGWNH